MNALTPEPSDHLRIVAVIQARMGSTRLPGKVLKPIAGKPLLWHIVHRLKRSQFIEEIAIATSTNPLDDAIVEFGREHGVPRRARSRKTMCSPRFARAAELLDADVIVRVNADAPFVDAGFIDHLVAAMIEDNADYVLLEEGAVTAHEGVDPMSRRALDKLMMDAADDPVAREHVTGYFKLHPDFVRIARARPYPSLAREGARLTIDTPDDLAFVEAVHERLAAKAGEASLEDLLLLLEREPRSAPINAHVQQKAHCAAGGLALIRCDGGGRFGYGHVKRMVALAQRAARPRRHRRAVRGQRHRGRAGADPRRRLRGRLYRRARRRSRVGRHHRCARARHADLRSARRASTARRWRGSSKTVSLTAVDRRWQHDRRLAADFAYYPPLPQTAALDWWDSACVPRIGWEWALLGLSQDQAGRSRAASPRPTLLVTMGGSDPMGLTLQAAAALRQPRSGVPRALRHRAGHGRSKTRVARTIVGLIAQFRNPRRRRRSGHRICLRRSGAVRVRRDGL